MNEEGQSKATEGPATWGTPDDMIAVLHSLADLSIRIAGRTDDQVERLRKISLRLDDLLDRLAEVERERDAVIAAYIQHRPGWSSERINVRETFKVLLSYRDLDGKLGETWAHFPNHADAVNAIRLAAGLRALPIGSQSGKAVDE